MTRQKEQPGDFTRAIAAALRAEKAAADITNADLAERSGVGLSSIVRYLNADRVMSLETLDKLAAVFDKRGDEIAALAQVRRESPTRPTAEADVV